MIAAGWLLLLLPIVCFSYAYVLYPLILRVVAGRGLRRDGPAGSGDDSQLPSVTLLLPVFNEAATVAEHLRRMLALDYPADRRQILVVSDCSSDGTDEIVAQFAADGVELLRMPVRGGKTLAENAAAVRCRGDIVVTIDATVRVPPASLRSLIRAFDDATVGVASGRDISIGAADVEGNAGEAGYVGFEMGLRALETRFGSIVGASGCFFAVRREIQESDFPGHLSKDFATPLRAWRRGYRSVSVDAAVCFVPRTPALQSEYRRKVRTMSRGLQTLFHERDLLNPWRHGRFAWMLWSHKVVRWLVFLTVPAAFLGLLLLAVDSVVARLFCLTAVLGVAAGLVAICWPGRSAVPRPLALCGFLLAAHAAGFMAWVQALRGTATSVWEPTRRERIA